MKLQLLFNDIAARTGVKTLFQLLLLGSVATNVCLGIAIARADRTHRETLIPPVVSKPFWVEDARVSPEYLEQMGTYLLQLALNNTPASAEYNARQLLKYASPNAYGELEQALLINARRLKEDNASVFFTSRGVTPNERDNAVAFNGVLTTLIGDKRVSELPKSYLIRFGFSGGHIYIIELRETEQNAPFKDEPQKKGE